METYNPAGDKSFGASEALMRTFSAATFRDCFADLLLISSIASILKYLCIPTFHIIIWLPREDPKDRTNMPSTLSLRLRSACASSLYSKAEQSIPTHSQRQ